MIKILLEHIDSGSDEQQKKRPSPPPPPPTIEGCDLCIEFQEAYERILMEKEQIVEVLNSIERENQDLANNSQQTAKLIEKLELQIQANKSNQQQQLADEEQHKETSQTADASAQSDNSSN